MNLMQRIRAYHITLATVTILTFVTGDFGLIHDFLGYALAAVIVLRLLWALLNPRQVGLNRFYPQFEGLRSDNWIRQPGVSQILILGIAITLIGALITGVLLPAGGEVGNVFWEKLHETFSKLVIMLVILHALYLIAFRRPLARFMLHRDRWKSEKE